ncbi:SDR family NAD(P)-dependent oxidoreductase [Methylobacterium sp. A49B]
MGHPGRTQETGGSIFVTGATSGFGLPIARRFAQASDPVATAERRRERLQTLFDELGPHTIHALGLDVRDRRPVKDATSALPAAFAAIDVLVNNAGLAVGLEPAQAADLDGWEAMVDTNILGSIYVTHAVLPRMVARNACHVVNVGSTAASYPYPGGNVYGATKAFVRPFSLNSRANFMGRRARVTEIDPGLVGGTAFSSVRFRDYDARAAGVCHGADALTPEDVADTVYSAATRPARVNINVIELMPVTQAFGPLVVHRGGRDSR